MKSQKFDKVFNYIQLTSVILFLLLVTMETYKIEKEYIVLNNDLNKSLESHVIDENQEEVYFDAVSNIASVGSFTGTLTAYVGDCPKCTGVLACLPWTNVLESGIYFNDSEYGEVRIVATSKNYPCGTIIRFNLTKLGSEPIIAVAMDRGVSSNVVDLLVEDVAYAYNNVGTIRNQHFEVLRYGWPNE